MAYGVVWKELPRPRCKFSARARRCKCTARGVRNKSGGKSKHAPDRFFGFPPWAFILFFVIKTWYSPVGLLAWPFASSGGALF